MIFLILIIAISTANKIPELFSGSPEVFSGYLPEREKYVEAFSYHEECTVIEGTAASVSDALAKLNPKGKFHTIFKRNI